MKSVLFIIDDIELKYFEFNDLVTNFWLIKGLLEGNYSVDIAIKNDLYLNNSQAFVSAHTTFLDSKNGISYNKEYKDFLVNNYDVVFYRPDPPVDINYVNACSIFDFVDREKTLLINDPSQIKNFGEKFHINKFINTFDSLEFVTKNIITASTSKIIDFLKKEGKSVIKPLNQCFGMDVFCLDINDKNLSSIIKNVTNNNTSMVMVQKYLKGAKDGDKRILLFNGEVYDECIIKLPGENDFKFNLHSDISFAPTQLTSNERRIAQIVANELKKLGLYMVGIDMLDEKIIELNLTSPCFFFREINHFYNTNFQLKVLDSIENLIRERDLSIVC